MINNGQTGSQTSRVADGIEMGIREGTFPPGAAIPSYRSLSNLYQVSVNTVRRAVDTLVRRGLLYRKERSGTYVCSSSPARGAFESCRLNCITFIETRPSHARNGFNRDYLAGYGEALEGVDVKMRFEVPHSDTKDFESLLSDDFSLNEQGCVLVNFLDGDFMEWLNGIGVPFVVQEYCYYPIEEFPPHHRVYVNKVRAGFDAAGHLLDIGHRRIGFAGLTELPRGLPGLYDGYRAALFCAGVGPRKEDILEIFTDKVEVAIPYVRRYLNGRNLPTAVFCKTDALALAFLEVAKELGIDVPEDLSVVGFNDVAEAKTTTPALTTLASPRRHLAKTAAQMLLSVAQQRPASPQERMLQCHLHIRDSTQAPKSLACVK